MKIQFSILSLRLELSLSTFYECSNLRSVHVTYPIRLWKRVLTPEEVRSSMITSTVSTSLQSALIGDWPLTDTTENRISPDHGPHALDGYVTEGGHWVLEGSDQCFELTKKRRN